MTWVLILTVFVNGWTASTVTAEYSDKFRCKDAGVTHQQMAQQQPGVVVRFTCTQK